MFTEAPLLHHAILQTLTYADIFDYPRTAAEIHRYLVGVHTSLETIKETLANGLHSSRVIVQKGEYFILPGREELSETRKRRANHSARLWPYGLYYGRILENFPFVRMVALTGALAVANVEDGADVDYFIVTESGRLWLCRAMIIGLVRVAARRGIIICPNFFLAENALELPDRNLYIAREVTQMIPLSGMDIYQRIRQANHWVYELLPNADGPPSCQISAARRQPNPVKNVIETLFHSPLGAGLERWEMNRKIQKFTTNFPSTAETRFSPDRCQGHFDGYGKKTMEAFQARLDELEFPRVQINSNEHPGIDETPGKL